MAFLKKYVSKTVTDPVVTQMEAGQVTLFWFRNDLLGFRLEGKRWIVYKREARIE